MVQDALGRIEGLLDTLFETAEDAIFLMDRVRFVDCNPSTLRMFGCQAKEQIVGRSPLAFSPDRQPDGSSSQDKATRLISDAIGGVRQNFEWRHCRLDRTEFDVEVRLNRFLVSGAPFLIAVVRDITARKHAEAALQRQALSDQLINRILSRCAMCVPREFDGHMHGALQELAGFLGADHAHFFFMTSRARNTYSCTHEVCGPGVAPLRPRYQDVPMGGGGRFERPLLMGEIVRINSAGDLLASAAAELASTDRGCRSLLLIPARSPTGATVGAIGVDSHARQVTWSESDVVLCRIIGNALIGITERKRAHDRLLDAKQFSERIIDSLPGLFYLYDSDLRLRRWNSYHEAKLGFTADELSGKPLADWFADDEGRRRGVEVARQILERDGAADFLESNLVHKDGSIVPYLVSGTRVESSEGPMLVGVGFDISGLRRVQRALEASERYNRALLDATNDAIAIHDEDGRLLDFNERACSMFGFRGAEARRLSIGDLSVNEELYTQQAAIERIRLAIRQGPQVFEWHSRRRDGTTFWSEVALRAFELEGKERVIALVRDVTERKCAADERERLLRRLRPRARQRTSSWPCSHMSCAIRSRRFRPAQRSCAARQQPTDARCARSRSSSGTSGCRQDS
jgi:PAS domain S-box-containing protein